MLFFNSDKADINFKKILRHHPKNSRPSSTSFVEPCVESNANASNGDVATIGSMTFFARTNFRPTFSDRHSYNIETDNINHANLI